MTGASNCSASGECPLGQVLLDDGLAAALLDWSNVSMLLVFLAALGLAKWLFVRLADVELAMESEGDTFLGALKSSFCGCCGCGDDDDRSSGLSRTSTKLQLNSESWRDEEKYREHLRQPALMLCFAAAVLSSGLVIRAATSRPVDYLVNANATAAESGASPPWLASWTVDGGDSARLARLGGSAVWAGCGLVLLALSTLVLRRSLSSARLLALAARKGNLAAGVADAGALLAAGAVVSGALPPRGSVDQSLSFAEQLLAATLSVVVCLLATVLFAAIFTRVHLGLAKKRTSSHDDAVDGFVTDKVQDKYQIDLPDGKRTTKGNLPLAIVYASALTSYALIIGRASAASLELAHLGVWCGGGGLLLVLGCSLAKMVASGCSRKKENWKTAAKKHNWGHAIVIAATMFSLGLAATSLIPRRGCLPSALPVSTNSTGMLSLPPGLVVLRQASFGTSATFALLTTHSAVVLVAGVAAVLLAKASYELPLCCYSVGGGRGGRRRCRCCDFNLSECIREPEQRAVSISFAGYTLAVGNILAATLGHGSADFTSSSLGNATALGEPDVLAVTLDVIGAVVEEILGAAGPQLAWTLMSFGMMTLAHYVHALAIGWQMSSDEDSDDEDSDDEGYPAASGLGRMMNANDCAYAVMDAGLYVASSFIIASSCAGRALSARDMTLGWLCFGLGELGVCAFAAATGLLASRRRDASVEELRSRNRKEIQRWQRDHPSGSVGDSLNWSLHLISWVLLLSSLSTLVPSVLLLVLWGALGGLALLASQFIVMGLIHDGVASEIEGEQYPTDSAVEEGEQKNWGAGLVGGTVAVTLAMLLVGVALPRGDC